MIIYRSMVRSMPSRLAERHTLPRGPQPAQPLDQQRVLGERLRLVDQRVQHLVVAGRRHLELVPDRLLLGAGELPPLTLEGEDLRIPGTQLAGRITMIGVLMRDDNHVAIIRANNSDVIRVVPKRDTLAAAIPGEASP